MRWLKAYLTGVSYMSEHIKIIVVEDDVSLAKFWKRLSEQFPCNNFKIFSSPHEALEDHRGSPADILITDLNLPEMDGIELIKRAKNINHKMKVVVTSGYIEDMSQFAGIAPFIHILKKPYKSIEYIREFVSLMLGKASEISGAEEQEDGVYVWDL